MKSNKHQYTLAERIFRRFYGIQGVMDEYKLSELRRIGNNAFIAIWWVSLLGDLVAVMVAMRNTTMAFWILITINLLTWLFASTYVVIAGHRAHLSEQELTQTKIKPARQEAMKAAVKSGLIFGVLMYIFGAGFEWLADGTALLAYLSDWTNAELAVLQAIFFGGIMGMLMQFRIKNPKE